MTSENNSDVERSRKRPNIKERAEHFYSTGESPTKVHAILKARVEDLKEKRRQLERQHKAIVAGLKKAGLSKKHRDDTKRKIMIGGWVVAIASKNPTLRSIIENDAIPYLAKLEPDLFNDFNL